MSDWRGPRPKPYDLLVEKLEAFEARPYAIRMGHRDWTELRRDPRTRKALVAKLGDPMLFMGVPVRLEGRRTLGLIKGAIQRWDAEVYETAQDLHDALYGES